MLKVAAVILAAIFQLVSPPSDIGTTPPTFTLQGTKSEASQELTDAPNLVMHGPVPVALVSFVPTQTERCASLQVSFTDGKAGYLMDSADVQDVKKGKRAYFQTPMMEDKTMEIVALCAIVEGPNASAKTMQSSQYYTIEAKSSV